MNICMIGGSGRCGTTILRDLFSLHPDVAIVPEWRFLTDPDGLVDFYSGYSNWSPYHIDLRIKRLEKLLNDLSGSRGARNFFRVLQKSANRSHFPFHLMPRYQTIDVKPYCPHFSEFSRMLIHELSSFSFSGYWTGMKFMCKNRIRYHPPLQEKHLREIFRNFLHNIFGEVLEQQKADHYLEKNPWFLLSFDRILNLLPEARLVHIHRDPRDVVASYTRQVWMPSDPEKCAIIYKDIMTRWRHIRETIPANTYLEISLESLVKSPETTLKQVCAFWNIPWHEGILKTDLSKSNPNRWRNDFDTRERQKISEILKGTIAEFGHE